MPVVMTKRPTIPPHAQPPDDDDMLAAEYALGVLQGEAREAFARRLADDRGLSENLRFWEEHFAQLAEEIAPVAPPQHVLARIENSLFTSRQQSPKPSLWNSLGFWRGLAVASLVAVVAVGGWNYSLQQGGAPGEALVAEVAGEQGLVRLVAFYDEKSGELRINRTEGTAAAGRSFELWLIAGQDAPVSLGVLPTETTSRHTIQVALRGKFPNGVLAISDEPQGGSPTGAPTGAVLATGKLTEI
jgi:anti-sigma-K factor RskA